MWRFKLVFSLFVLAFLAILTRLFYWQVLSSEELKKIAEAQHFFRLKIAAARGDILASDGSSLVTNQPAYLIFVEKKKIEDEKVFVKKIAPILEETEASTSAKLAQENLWIPLKHKVEDEKVRELRALKVLGLGFEREDRRYYPEASMSANLLGFVGKDNLGNDKGYFGLEGYYDKELAGQEGYLQQEKDALGAPIVIGESERIEPENGRTLVLHLDKTVQFIAEEKLKEGLRQYKARSGNVIIIDPKTGGILASASYPSYDPTIYGEFPKEYYQNPVVGQSYEPGSTFKVLIMAKAIDEETVKPTDKYNESGPVKIDDYSIKTWNNEYHGEITITEVLEHSSNVGMVSVAKKLGKEKILEALRGFRFGQKTGIDLEEESSPSIRPDNEWREIDLATVSFGQGIAVTPIQMVRAVAALANGGYLLEPHVVKKIVSDDGQVVEVSPKKIRQVVKSSTAKVLTEMMVSAVTKGEAKWAVPKGYRIAGKTGTAQIPVAGHYDTEKTIASFVGFAPADEPKFVMLVTLREPETSPWGSETAAPLFFEIAKDLFTYYGISPLP